MILAIECVVLSLVMWLISYLGTGNDAKNIKSFKSYPLELQEKLLKDDRYNKDIKESNPWIIFFSNLVLFLVIIFVFGLFIRTEDFFENFVALLILGETVNLFDLAIVDLLWFTNTKHVRFSHYPDAKLYKDMTNHVISFIKGALMFIIIAIIDSAILMLF